MVSIPTASIDLHPTQMADFRELSWLRSRDVAANTELEIRSEIN
ncbi:hypothetical protein [Chamaesiphon sp. VAR_69_metabat_338]|nr:hypothetical protein [Chamaesiphon sp. VAR_69_metabat_338]